jgi:hypothetical protein
LGATLCRRAGTLIALPTAVAAGTFVLEEISDLVMEGYLLKKHGKRRQNVENPFLD